MLESLLPDFLPILLANFRNGLHFALTGQKNFELQWILSGVGVAALALGFTALRGKITAKSYWQEFIAPTLDRATIKQDVIGIFINLGLWALLAAAGLSGALLTRNTVRGMVTSWLPKMPSLELEFYTGHALNTVILFLLWDLAFFLAHYLMHRSPALWQIHKIHHSAPRLNPLTAARVHFLEAILNGLATSIVVGVGLALMSALLKVPNANGREPWFLMGDLYLIHLLFINLRHSHVPIGYGPFLSRILVSPHMHQVHHSHAREHLDKNFGVAISLWDQIVGSYYLPKKGEKLSFGLADGEEMARLQNPYRWLIEPFRAWGELLRRKSGGGASK